MASGHSLPQFNLSVQGGTQGVPTIKIDLSRTWERRLPLDLQGVGLKNMNSPLGSYRGGSHFRQRTHIFGGDQGYTPEIMDEILTTARDLELEMNEDDIEELIMGHENELTTEELQEILNEEHQETQ
ncbi:hypothetical protein TNCV_1885691 [Trichonephila clavipes]|nr:hypothetical protein TNCV_1885691 [Trichonephila clavipes]